VHTPDPLPVMEPSRHRHVNGRRPPITSFP
jgi:hypothetical protein